MLSGANRLKLWPRNVSAPLVAPAGGVLVSWKEPSYTEPVNVGYPLLSPYSEVIVDQLSFGCTPSPA